MHRGELIEDEGDEETIENIEEEAAIEEQADPLSSEDRKFYEAYNVHWVHAENRRIRTRYICDLMLRTLGQ